MPCFFAAQQESREAAQRAQAPAGQFAAAGHTTTGQTLRQQADAAAQNPDPEVGAARCCRQAAGGPAALQVDSWVSSNSGRLIYA